MPLTSKMVARQWGLAAALKVSCAQKSFSFYADAYNMSQQSTVQLTVLVEAGPEHQSPCPSHPPFLQNGHQGPGRVFLLLRPRSHAAAEGASLSMQTKHDMKGRVSNLEHQSLWPFSSIMADRQSALAAASQVSCCCRGNFSFYADTHNRACISKLHRSYNRRRMLQCMARR